MDISELILQRRIVFKGTLFMIKNQNYLPWQPSGMQGRYNGDGTYAYYFGDTLMTCCGEILKHTPKARCEDYRFWAVTIESGTFIDICAVEGTQYLLSRDEGGYGYTQELSNRLADKNVFGFRYISQPTFTQGTYGTCFCIYQSALNLGKEYFREIIWGSSK